MQSHKIISSAALSAALMALVIPRLPANPIRNILADPLKQALSIVDQERDLQTDLFILARQRPARREAGSCEKLYWGNRNRREIALTFDDGPHPKFVPTILHILAEHHAKATFFVIGELAERYPNVVIEEAMAGNQVSNHTYHHARLHKVIPEMAGPEIEACDVALERILKRPSDRYFRPPGGEIDENTMAVCRHLGKTPVLYTDDPQDFKNVGEKVLLERLLKNAAPGGIILLHDNVKQTVHILPTLLSTLEEQGYRFVTIAQLDAHRTLPPDTFTRHTSTVTADAMAPTANTPHRPRSAEAMRLRGMR
jgi:peptidoglycan/xylan/chitin deacetylase (PgdA/CDA1 family)